MIDKSKIGLRVKLTAPVSPVERFFRVGVGIGTAMRPEANTHVYASLYGGERKEVVKVVGGYGDVLEVRRGCDGTVAQNFQQGTCVEFDWSPIQLCEYMSQCGQQDKPFMSPGTYCLECTTCIDVDAYGRITNIDGAESC